MPKTKPPKRSQQATETTSVDRWLFTDESGEQGDPSNDPPFVRNWNPPGITTSSAEMWRAFLREYAKPVAKAPGWFAADSFRIELTDGRELPLAVCEVNPSADTLLVLRTRDREEVATSAVPWSQVGRISVVTHSGGV